MRARSGASLASSVPGWGALGRPHSWGHSSLGQASTRLQPVHPSEARTLLPPRLRVRRRISTPETPLSGFPIRFRKGLSVGRYSALCAGAGGCGAEKPFLLLAEGVHGVEA